MAVDACLTGLEHLSTNVKSCGYAIVRPPGHHVHVEQSSGFCYFNNVAIVAKKAAKEGKKVMIVDWDVHQGDGTQDLLY